MRTIWKYTIRVTDEVELEMPKGALILPHIHQPTYFQLNFWAVVDGDQGTPLEKRRFEVCGTGNPMSDEPKNYIGTVVSVNGFVWHVFELTHVPITSIMSQIEGPQ